MPLLFILYVIIPVAQVIMFMQGQIVFELADTLNYGASILCFHWLLANVVLSSKIPALQRSIPYDARIRFHIFATMGIAATLAYHTTYKFAMGKNIDLVSWALLIVFASMMLVALLWIPVRGFSRARAWLLNRFRPGTFPSYDRSKSIHSIAVLTLTALLFLHIYNTDMLNDVPFISVLLYGLTWAGTLVLYLVSKTGLFRVAGHIVSVDQHNEIHILHIVTGRHIRYRSGQFAFLRMRGASGRMEEHPFSFLSIPGEATVSFAIRVRGDFTHGLRVLKPGDCIWISGGYGDFRPHREKALCFIAAGIGTAPFISILKQLSEDGDKRQLDFHLAVNNRDEIPEYERLKEISRAMPNVNLHLLVHSVDGLRYSEEYFRQTISEPAMFSYYVCSSPRVRSEILRSLKAIGVPQKAVRFEEFSLG